uniref:non-specific serine/threonine protein kinase n=1 Tax=Haemonchus contortus TaxID=6289 RepID=A0A7I4XV13_HAECO
MIDDQAATRFPPGKRFGNWVIIRRIDEGGFGQVYKVENLMTKKLAALKAESNEIEGGSALKLEMNVMKAIASDGEKPHVPNVFHAAKRRRYCYMIMTLLGENLKELKLSCPKEHMTAKTWSRIAIQCLYSIKVVHDYGFVHRDIKPNNFVMGHREDYERARLVHILDFGLSRSYAVRQKDGKWVARRARGTAEFRGTLRYCSPNVHEKKEQGRRDDLWSLYYVFIELHCGLPWQTVRDKQKVELLKMNMNDKDLVLNFPVELHGIIPYLRTLDYYQRPDYSMFYNGLVAVMKRVGAKPSDPYDWEKPETVRNIQKRLKGPYAWENAADFFKSDPVKVNSAPPAKKKKRKETMKIFSPLVDDDGKKDSSDHTTASTDLDRRSMPTELTMTDVDRKLFEKFGIRRKDDDRLRELGKRLSGELIRKPSEVDDSLKAKDAKEVKQEVKPKDKKEVEKVKVKEKAVAPSKEKAVPAASKEKAVPVASKEKTAPAASKEKAVSKEKVVTPVSKEKVVPAGSKDKKGKTSPAASKGKVSPTPKEKVSVTPREKGSVTPNEKVVGSKDRIVSPAVKEVVIAVPKEKAVALKEKASPKPSKEKEVAPKEKASPKPSKEKEVAPKEKASPKPSKEKEAASKEKASPVPSKEKVVPKSKEKADSKIGKEIDSKEKEEKEDKKKTDQDIDKVDPTEPTIRNGDDKGKNGSKSKKEMEDKTYGDSPQQSSTTAPQNSDSAQNSVQPEPPK